MPDHLLKHVQPYLDRGHEERIAYIRAPRWIGHHVAKDAHRRLAELLSRPSSLRTQGLMLVGPYANGKTMIAERFTVECLRASPEQRVWIAQTREGAGLGHTSMQAFSRRFGHLAAIYGMSAAKPSNLIICWTASNQEC